MDDSTRLGIGAARLLLLGVVVVGTLAAVASVMRRAGEVVKPIAKLYDVNQVNSANTPGGGLAPLGTAPASGTAPVATPPMGDPNALPQLLGQLSKNGNGDVKRTIAALQKQLGQDAPAAEQAAPAGDGAELAEVKRQLAECQAQIKAMAAAAEQERQRSEAVAQSRPVEKAAAEPDLSEALNKQELDYAEAVQRRQAAEAVLEQVKMNPKATQEQIVEAAYELMDRRSVVTRLEGARARAHRMAVATVAD